MQSKTSWKSPFSRVAAAISLVTALPFLLISQDGDNPPGFARTTDLSDRFFQIQDESGFFWQAAGNGALTSGETQYLQSGLNLLVGGEAFAPTLALVRGPKNSQNANHGQLILSEAREGLEISRQLYFYSEESSVRVVDAFTNTGGDAISLSVQLRTTYPFGWQSLHGEKGGLLSTDPVLQLGEEDRGFIIHFSAAEGRHSTLILCGNEGEAIPELTASANRREFTLSYNLTIPAGETRSLLHWISQLTLPELDMAEEKFARFFQAGRLVEPPWAAQRARFVANFADESLPTERDLSVLNGQLLALNEFLDTVGVHRRPTDLLWVSAGSQLSGSVSEEAEFTVAAASGEPSVIPVAQVAAVRGEAGSGMPSRLFLRNGTVLSGPISVKNFSFQAAGSEEPETLEMETLRLLLLATGDDDGTVPDNTIGYLQFLDRSVSAVVNPDTTIAAVAPWGEVELPIKELEEITHVSRPAPSHRVILSDGSRYTVFLKHRNFSTTLAREGQVELDGGSIVRFWLAGTEKISIESTEDFWLDFSEVPDDSAPDQGFLLRGNNFIAGDFAVPELTVEASGTSIRIETKRIQSVRRNLDVTTDQSFRYLIELVSGESVEGDIREDYLPISHQGREIRVPTINFFAFRRPPSS